MSLKVKVLLLVGIAICAWQWPMIAQMFDAQKIITFFRELEPTPYTFIFFLLAFALGTCVFIPIAGIAIGVALIFPFWLGLVCTILGTMFAAFTGYMMGAKALRPYLPNKLKLALKRFAIEKENEGTLLGILALRLAPTPPFTITSIAAGSIKAPLVAYLSASVIGLLPLLILIQLLGSQIEHVLSNPTVTVMFSIVALAILGITYYRLKHRFKNFLAQSRAVK